MNHLIRGLATFGATFLLFGMVALVVSKGADPVVASLVASGLCGAVVWIASAAEDP